MKPIRVGFSTSKHNPLSKLIRWFTRSTVSHAFLIYWDTDWQRDMVMEATSGGVRIVPIEHYEKQIVCVFTPKHPLDAGLAKAVDWLGEHFDYSGLVGMVWVRIGRWLGRKWRNPLRSAHGMFCSEFVSRTMVAVPYPGTGQWDPQSIDPQALVEFFSKEQAT